MNTKFELPEGKWLVVVKNGKVKIRNMEGRVTLSEDSFLKVKSEMNKISKAVSEVKSLI